MIKRRSQENERRKKKRAAKSAKEETLKIEAKPGQEEQKDHLSSQ